MLVACRGSHVIQVFKINKKTGMMVDTKQDMF
ncbi:lactonase family protein [Prevotella copri]|nr:lactonase family protein [Segatella copri]MCW4085096.1 lactonase family protein [Segatella copri]MCW4159974.1 lactonase family protein [Segatella copri]